MKSFVARTLPATALAIGLAATLPSLALAAHHEGEAAETAVDAAADKMVETAPAAAAEADAAMDGAAEEVMDAATGAATDAASDAMAEEEVTITPEMLESQLMPVKVDPVDVMMRDRIIGNPDAPVTIVEYASMTCPHCAAFHNTVLPTVKEQLIDTGKARLILRDFPLDLYALSAAQLARCAPEDRYEKLVEVIFKQQPTWARSRDPLLAVKNIAKLGGGMSDAEIDACLANDALKTRMGDALKEYSEKWEIKSTPTFVLYNTEGEVERIEGNATGAASAFARTVDKLTPAATANE